jgi:hypothetical protein
MNKKVVSTFERKMKNVKFKKAYEKSYKKLLFSELMIAVMTQDDKSVRKLAKEANLSPSVVQDLRTGKQCDIKVSNFIHIAQALGYEILLRKDKEYLTLLHDIKNHISVVSSPLGLA